MLTVYPRLTRGSAFTGTTHWVYLGMTGGHDEPRKDARPWWVGVLGWAEGKKMFPESARTAWIDEFFIEQLWAIREGLA